MVEIPKRTFSQFRVELIKSDHPPHGSQLLLHLIPRQQTAMESLAFEIEPLELVALAQDILQELTPRTEDLILKELKKLTEK